MGMEAGITTQDPGLQQVREYYGRVLGTRKDLKTSACCTSEEMAPHLVKILRTIDGEILDKFYGCGSPIPSEVEGRTVVDLGCGTGRDSYLLSALVGPQGRVIGIDMTEEQLEVARRHLRAQTRTFGYRRPNLEFRQGFIEDLGAIPSDSVDVVISNCVINLSPDKPRAFSEIFRVLKPGGELCFSDVFAGRRVPDALRRDPVLYGECLSGALYVEDFRRLLRAVGCPDHRLVSKRRIEVQNPELAARAGRVDFYSMTVRAFKLDDLEDICEDYGQVAAYRGTLPDSPSHYVLDDHHLFEAGKPAAVCGNTASMLQNTRLARHFEVTGSRRVHYGPFDCPPTSASQSEDRPSGGACC